MRIALTERLPRWFGRLDATEEEAWFLRSWRDAFALFHGREPRVERGSHGFTVITFPFIDDPFGFARMMVGNVSLFTNRPRLTEHLRSLGYDWDDRGRIVTAPSPRSFGPVLAARGFPGAGFRTEYTVLDDPDLPVSQWFNEMAHGVVAVNIASRRYYTQRSLVGWRTRLRSAEPRWDESQQREITRHLLLVQHDMTKHALLLHLVPGTCVREFGRTIALRAGEEFQRWTREPRPKPPVPQPILRFYENDIVVYCHRVWESISGPEEFEEVFTLATNYRQLMDLLEKRVAQSLDASTADSLKTDYVPPRFDVRLPLRAKTRSRG